ncbi:hypothetical protein CHARACLAT_001351 [Characodon lateralis]|uniref:Uncharacterized protein n=1 Tax=Characodon lateralis TaxID=208331 RepID=A0ABU7DCP4_9TELE|nr:hypothetical protein [Characodon lateralis]
MDVQIPAELLRPALPSVDECLELLLDAGRGRCADWLAGNKEVENIHTFEEVKLPHAKEEMVLSTKQPQNHQ